ncbi:MAG: hypothetical protein AYK18_11705 [Theionarchaea archaeon DG-70]|nr:MAG: hypothetical protein AYK18_11705 [Theionarchaea archaeon DG-70]
MYIITTRKKIFREVLSKTKICERIVPIDKFLFELEEYPKDSLKRILDNHLKYREFSAREMVIKHEDLILPRLGFPHNIDYFVDIIPEGIAKEDLTDFVRRAEIIKIAKKEELQTLTDEEKLLLSIISITISISLEDLEKIFNHFAEELGYEKERISKVLAQLDNWLRYKTEKIFYEPILKVGFYHSSYRHVVFEELVQKEELIKKIFNFIFQFENMLTKTWIPVAIVNHLDILPEEVVNLLIESWSSLDPFLSTTSGICLVDRFNDLPNHLKEFFLENFLKEGFCYRDIVLAHMIERYDSLPELLKSTLIAGLNYEPQPSTIKPPKDRLSQLQFRCDEPDNLDLIERNIGVYTMDALLKYYDTLPEELKGKVAEFSESEMIKVRGDLASALMKNYKILPPDLLRFIPQILDDGEIRVCVGESIVSNYNKLPDDIKDRLFVLWGKIDLREKTEIARCMISYYEDLPQEVKTLLTNAVEEGYEELILSVCNPIIFLYDYSSDSRKVFMEKSIERLNEQPLIESADSLHMRGLFINCAMLKLNKLPEVVKEYVLRNWKTLNENDIPKFLSRVSEYWDNFPEKAADIFYEALRSKNSTTVTVAVLEAVKEYSRMPFEITRMLPAAIEKAKPSEKALLLDPYYKLQESILENWDILPVEIREFAFSEEKTITISKTLGLINVITQMFENYSKFPERVNKYIWAVMRNLTEDTKEFIIASTFLKMKKSPNAERFFSCLVKNPQIRMKLISHILGNYYEIHDSLKDAIFEVLRDDDPDIRFHLAMGISVHYDNLPKAVQDLGLEITETLSQGKRNSVLACFGFMFVEKEKFKEAQTFFEKILEEFPENEMALAFLCEISMILGEKEEKMDYLDKIDEILPTEKGNWCLIWLAYRFAEKQMFEVTKEIYERILGKNLKNENDIASVCEISILLGEYTIAGEYLNKMEDSENSEIRLLFAFFSLCLSAFQDKDCILQFNRLLKRFAKISIDQLTNIWNSSYIELVINERAKEENKLILLDAIKLLKGEVSADD